MKTQTIRKAGFTLVEIMIVVAIIGLLAAIAIPNFIRARVTSQTNSCVNNLRQIDGAKQQWALENNQPSGVTPGVADLSPYLGRATGGATLDAAVNGVRCPAGGTYSGTINPVDQKPGCSIGGFHMLP